MCATEARLPGKILFILAHIENKMHQWLVCFWRIYPDLLIAHLIQVILDKLCAALCGRGLRFKNHKKFSQLKELLEHRTALNLPLTPVQKEFIYRLR